MNAMNLHVLLSVYNISGYLIACLEELEKYAKIAVIETPCNGIAKGALTERVLWVDRRGIGNVTDIDIALGDFKPDIFFCGGWADKVCVQYARLLHERGVETVLAADTPWQAKVRQIVHCLYSRFYLTQIFHSAWGAGEPQERYLHYLGFPLKRIHRGYYCANTTKFAPIGESRIERFKMEKKWPHIFLYIGRYIAVKNMRRMERAFINASEGTDWKLICIGNGKLWSERTIHPRIEHLGYKSPDEIQNYVAGAGCFVLPSIYEPWGVVVHEAALMGLPIICSKQIQAATQFLVDDLNGFKFDPYDETAIEESFRKIIMTPDFRMNNMGLESLRLGKSYTLNNWVERALSFVSSF